MGTTVVPPDTDLEVVRNWLRAEPGRKHAAQQVLHWMCESILQLRNNVSQLCEALRHHHHHHLSTLFKVQRAIFASIYGFYIGPDILTINTLIKMYYRSTE